MNLYIVALSISSIVILVLFYLYLRVIEQRNNLRVKYAVLRSRYENDIKSSNEKIKLLMDAKEKLALEFQSVAERIFEEKSQKLNYTNKEHIEMLLKPFREQITDFSIQSREQFNYELKERHLLKDEITRLKEMSYQLSKDANNLTNALKGDNKLQGDWGEMVLERILEESGLHKGREYLTQVSLKSKEGAPYRPDIILKMPQNRDIVIDAKVSLKGYEKYINAQSTQEKQKYLKEHLNSIDTHIKNLSAKNYEKLEGIDTLDYILLFIPIEGAFITALKYDEDFFTKSYTSNILVVSPSTLLVTLKTIEHIWRTHRQHEHIKNIIAETEAMYEKLYLFVDEMQKMGISLQKAQESYQISMKRLKSGKGNVISRAKSIVELGVKPKREIKIEEEI